MKIKKKKLGGGGRVGSGGLGWGGCQGGCERRLEVGDQGRCERRSEVFCENSKIIFFFFGGGGGGGVRVDVNGEVKFL